MARPIGFDNEKYLAEQTAAINERVARFHDKLYLEFGGKLLFDYHAARVLPGFDPNVKMRLLQQLNDRAEVVLCIYAGDIEKKKMRADFGITYDADALKLIDDLGEQDVVVRAVVITRYDEQPAAKVFKRRLENHGVPPWPRKRRGTTAPSAARPWSCPTAPSSPAATHRSCMPRPAWCSTRPSGWPASPTTSTCCRPR